ncbi:MAG TPA: zf-TFIIB domain-containing protein [Verrucomicrobia bacterium]|nr:zf-TFIIB domain-containing protein [Verrucomicrobiota bacterium]HOP97186.1 zf-TFIIB domain-containing protein [Verrucomicrobiota bacterium]HPU55700.1 zf-TFIIB domain-containing protein [Verrucomicrobiota bacterium]
MKCPACFHSLREIQIGALKVDVCQHGCGGIWLDRFELQQVDEEHETAGEPLVMLHPNPNVKVDPSLKRECPRCDGVKLKRHFFSAKRRVEVDECPGCGGYWLDHGELAQIRREKAEEAHERRLGQNSLTPEMIRYLYRLRTGAA